MKRIVLIMLSLISVPIVANKNFRQKHLPGVTKGPLLPVGMWHIEMDETDKLMDWFLYRQTVNTPEGKKYHHKLIMVSQDWGRLNPSKPMDVTVTEIDKEVNPPIHEMIIRLDNVLELVIDDREGHSVGTLYELRHHSSKTVGHVVRIAEQP